MKTKTLFIILCLAVTSASQAQEKQQHVAESKSLVGLWQHDGVVVNDFGEKISLKSGNYKVFNTDGTFYTFFIVRTEKCNPEKDKAHINMYATYSVTSDSTFTEHVIINSTVPRFNDSKTEIRYKFAPNSNNNFAYMLWNSTANNDWMPEMWERVTVPPKRKEDSQTL